MAEDRYVFDPAWEYVADRVMGGVSQGEMRREEVAGRMAHRLVGQVSTDNNGGFIQMAFDVAVSGAGWTGIEITVAGPPEIYDLRLRTTDLSRPWQSYRATFETTEDWQVLRLPFAEFEPNKTDQPFDASKLRRIGVLGYGRDFMADVAVAEVAFYE